MDQRLEAHARLAPDIERAHALRPVDLVAGDRQQVDVHRIDVERDLADRLRRVGVEVDLALAADLADLGQRLDHADLVVHRHHRHDAGVRADRGLQLLEVDEAVLLDRQIGDLEAFQLQVAAGIQHALMLGHHGDDVVLLALVEMRDALEREVVRFGRAGGEDDLLLVRADDRRDLSARLLHRLLRLPSRRRGCANAGCRNAW